MIQAGHNLRKAKVRMSQGAIGKTMSLPLTIALLFAAVLINVKAKHADI